MKFGMAAAIGLTVIAFMFEDKKRNLLCFLFICIASLFHISALLALVYFVVRKVSVTKQVFWGKTEMSVIGNIIRQSSFLRFCCQ